MATKKSQQDEKKITDVVEETIEKEVPEEGEENSEEKDKKEKSRYSDFDEGFGETIKAYKDTAEVFDVTRVIKFNPQYNDDVTEESLKKHNDFIADMAVQVSRATAEIAKEKLKENDEIENHETWKGKVDGLPGLEIESTYTPKAEYLDTESGNSVVEYANSEIYVNFKFSTRHQALLEACREDDIKQLTEMFDITTD